MPTNCERSLPKTFAASPEGGQQCLPEQARDNLQNRLHRGAMLLAIIDRRRRETRDPNLGASLERYLVNRELRELEESPEPQASDDSERSPIRVRARRSSALLLSKAGRWLQRRS